MLNDQEDYKLFVFNDKPSVVTNNLEFVPSNNSFVDNILDKQQNDNFNEDVSNEGLNKNNNSLNLINNEQIFYNELVPYEEKPTNLQQWNVNLDNNNTDSYFCFDKTFLKNDDNTESLLHETNVSTENNQDNYLINCQNESLFKFGDDEEDFKNCLEISSYLSNFNSNNYQHPHLNNNPIHSHFLQSNLSPLDYQIHHHPMINLNVYQQNSSHFISNSSPNQFQIPHHHITSIKNERNIHNYQFYNSQNNVMQNYNQSNETVVSSETRPNNSNNQRQNLHSTQQSNDQTNVIIQNKQIAQTNTQFNQPTDLNKKSNEVLQAVNTNVNLSNIFKPDLSKIRKKVNSKKKIITLNEVANVKLEKIKVAKPNGSKIYYFKCALCEYQTNTSQSMKDHLYCIHCRAKNNYRCKFCNQTFGWKNNAQRHMRRKHKIEDQTTKREAILSLI